MPILPPLPVEVPFEEVADVLSEAAVKATGGPAMLVSASGRHLAAALEAAGFRVVRQPEQGRQMTL